MSTPSSARWAGEATTPAPSSCAAATTSSATTGQRVHALKEDSQRRYCG